MTPLQKINWLIQAHACRFTDLVMPPYPEFPDFDIPEDYLQDAKEEVRSSGADTDLPSQSSRHYEAKEVAAQLPDDSWVGWTYWYGGGKHGEPSAVDWIEGAYDVECHVVLKQVQVFSLPAKEPECGP